MNQHRIVSPVRGDREARPTASGRARGGIGSVASSLGALLGFLLLPKCPLCVAALLAAAGLGTGAAALVAPVLRPAALLLAIVLGIIPIVFPIVFLARLARARVGWPLRRRRELAGAPATAPCCCEVETQPPARRSLFARG